MTTEDAIATLELDADALPNLDERSLKRMYLRQVKRHPPESDPDGFRRVRDAYEALQPILRFAFLEHVVRAREEAITPAPAAPVESGVAPAAPLAALDGVEAAAPASELATELPAADSAPGDGTASSLDARRLRREELVELVTGPDARASRMAKAELISRCDAFPVFEALTREAESSEEGVAWLDVPLAVDCALALKAQSLHAAASTLVQRIDRYLRATDSGKDLPNAVQAKWSFARDLALEGSVGMDELHPLLALGVLKEEPAQARRDAQSFRRRHPLRARALIRYYARHAPALHEFFREPRRSFGSLSAPARFGWARMVLGYVLLRALIRLIEYFSGRS